MLLPLHHKATVVQEHPSGLLAVEKPPQVRSHPNRSGTDRKSLLWLPYDRETECYSGDRQHWYLINRLDAPTSGLILLADNRETAEVAKAAFAARTVDKTYLAIVRGRGPRGTAEWKDNLRTTRQGRRLRVERSRSGDPAETRVKTLETRAKPPQVSLLSLQPKTGRTHQLRVQASLRHLPIVGDATYGDFRFNREWTRRGGVNRLYLHSFGLTLAMRVTGEQVVFTAETAFPECFRQAMA